MKLSRLEKCKLAYEKGFRYNFETGEITSPSGNIIVSKSSNLKKPYKLIGLWYNNRVNKLSSHIFAYWSVYGDYDESLQVDHINGIKGDNRIENLRLVTNQQNQFNREAKGYHFRKDTNKWRARVKLNGKEIHLGYFETELEARQAYLEAKEKYHII